MTISNHNKALFLAWQDKKSRLWFPIGKLIFDGEKYYFVYINGVKEAEKRCSFEPLLSFPNFDQVYSSIYLFPVFANRLMSKRRPEYISYLETLNLSKDETDLIEILGRSGGERETDSLTVFPEPKINEFGQYQLYFLAHGLRYLPITTIERIEQLQIGDRLWLAHEFHNSYDQKALTIHTEDHYIVGYCPRYLISEIFNILMSKPILVEVKVKKLNHKPTPIKYRLLCELNYLGLEGYQPFSTQEYQPLIEKNRIKV